MRRALGCAVAIAAVSSGCIDWNIARDSFCQDAGTCAVLLPDGGTAPNGGDGGNTPDGGDGGATPGVIPFASYCHELGVGLRRLAVGDETACGEPLTAEDLTHVSGGLGNYQATEEVTLCSDAGIFGASLNALAESMDAGRIAYDPRKSFDCRALGRRLDAGPSFSPFDTNGELIEPCRSVMVGLVPTGGACDLNEDCAGEGFCVPGGENTCAGVCQPRLALGAPCDPNRTACRFDAQCVQVDAGAFGCVALGSPGDPCSDNGDCKANHGCSSGSCAFRAPEGGACTNISTSPDDCQTDLVCVDGGTGNPSRCRVEARAGEPCGSPMDGLRPCGDCLRCRTEVTPAVCVSLGSVGDACLSDAQCKNRHFCSAGTCFLRPRPGEPCAVPSGAPPGDRGNCLWDDSFCRRSSVTSLTGVCQVDPALNQDCGSRFDLTTECQTGYCKLVTPSSGTCSPLPTVGQPCGDATYGLSPDCEERAFCNRATADGGTGPTGMCRVLPQAGENCAPGKTCAAGHFCTLIGSVDVCLAKRAAGSACTSDNQCVADLCDVVSRRCSIACVQTNNLGCSGCKGGMRDLSLFLLFALLWFPARRRWKPGTPAP